MGDKENGTIPLREDVPAKDRWNLSRLFISDKAWENALGDFEASIPAVEAFKGKLAQSAATLASFLAKQRDIGILGERLGTYAFLRKSENEGSDEAQGRFSRYMMAASAHEAATSFVVPEIQAIPQATMEAFLKVPELAEFGIYLGKILRFKPHVLSEREERLLAMQLETNETPQKAFSVLTNVDIDFGTVETPQGPRALSQSSFSSLVQDQDREVRKRAYLKLYGSYESHKNTIAALYEGSVKLDVYNARVRNYPSSRAAALFPDKVPESVYDNLIDTVNRNLGPLHRYYGLRKRLLGVSDLRHYDVYVPLVGTIKSHHTYEEAVDIVDAALAPLGDEYRQTLKNGLLNGWADRYENRGKRSGAFSDGTFTGDPYILLNYKEDVLGDVFTMAHEGGHSMHSWYSVKSNPYQHYNYTIFEAEVASTFNERLVFKHLLKGAQSLEMRAYLVNKQLDDILATLYRQTMFAEFEKRTHELLEKGEPLTVEVLRTEYRTLLERYFGPEMAFEPVSDLEGLRIPHFYEAFYVYKYATGISAAIALSERVLSGGESERKDYFEFLKSGGSRYPIESLKVAGVDMSSEEPIQAALDEFAKLLAELEGLTGN
jgi:oligoendopeptidase F